MKLELIYSRILCFGAVPGHYLPVPAFPMNFGPLAHLYRSTIGAGTAGLMNSLLRCQHAGNWRTRCLLQAQNCCLLLWACC